MNNRIDNVRRLFPENCHDRVLLVGGSVRDMLLNRAISDIDLIASLSPEEITACGFRLIRGKSTEPIWFRHDNTIGLIEATLISDASKLNDDLYRRDFTINAMAMTLAGEIIDPLHGKIDLERRLLRACTPQTFSSDPLRFFRALRFEADGWKLTDDTEKLIQEQDWSQSLAAIPIERFSREMLKALQMKEPERLFQRMLEFKAGEEYLPEIFRMQQVPAGPPEHHPEGSLFIHSCQVMQHVSERCDDPLTRFCAMFHDIGKLVTPTALYPRHHGHDQAGFGVAIEFCRRIRLPADYGRALSWISKLHGTFNLWDQLRDSTKLRLADQAVRGGIADILPLVAAADKPGGSTPKEWQEVVKIVVMTTADLGIDKDYLGHVPAKKRAAIILQARMRKLQNSGPD